MSATAKKIAKIKKTIKVQKMGRAMGHNDGEYFEGRMYHVEIKCGEYECNVRILTKNHNAKDILENLKNKSLKSILEGDIDYYNSNDVNDQYFSYGSIEYIFRFPEPKTKEN